jgi:hypothetical protein
MFDPLRSLRDQLRSQTRDLDPHGLTASQAAEAIEILSGIEHLAGGARLRLAKRLDTRDDQVDPADWLARTTGQARTDAARDIEASQRLDDLPGTDQAVRDGELSPTQAHQVTDGAAADPSAESELLHTARNASVPELRRHSRKVRAAAQDDAGRREEAHRRRSLRWGTDPDTGEGWFHGHGPADVVARLVARLQPGIQAQFRAARLAGRREGTDAYAFDALIALIDQAGAEGTGGGGGGAKPKVDILARIDAAAFRRGHTQAGETCEIDGLGPVPVAVLRQFLPDAAIKIIITNGVDIFNVTNFSRRATARQQIVLDWIGAHCTNLGCPNTRNLQVDHRVPWAEIHLTELVNLDPYCPPCHYLKTHQGWAPEPGTGRRRLLPPDHPEHPDRAPPVAA